MQGLVWHPQLNLCLDLGLKKLVQLIMLLLYEEYSVYNNISIFSISMIKISVWLSINWAVYVSSFNVNFIIHVNILYLTLFVTGWFQGERIRDGEKGWFPSSVTMEIQSAHVRAKNLRQHYRLMHGLSASSSVRVQWSTRTAQIMYASKTSLVLGHFLANIEDYSSAMLKPDQ